MTWSSTPYETAGTAGTEVSGGGQYPTVSIVESSLTHPTHADGFVDAGDPVVFGDTGAGVAKIDGAATTDIISVAMGGIWNLSVNANNGAVAIGERLYATDAAAAVTNTSTSSRVIGIALAAVGSGETVVIPVLVGID